MPEIASQSRVADTGQNAGQTRDLSGTEQRPNRTQNSAPVFSTERTAALHVLQARLNGAPQVTRLNQLAAQLNARPVQRAPVVVQRVPIATLVNGAEDPEDIVARLAGLIVNRPGGDDEAALGEFYDAVGQAGDYWNRLGANEVGDDAAAQQRGLLAALLEGDAPDGLQRRIRYYFGLGAAPRDAPRAIGTLGLTRLDGRIAEVTGRPGLFAIQTGGAAQARRHIVAWHTLRNLMNRLIARFNAHGVAEISRWVAEVADPEVARQSTEIALAQVGGDGVEFRLLWLAIMLNNVPHNLWLGAARENISINTMVGHLTRWTTRLRDGTLSVAGYRTRVAGYAAGSPMARQAIASILAETDDATVRYPGDAHLVIYDQFTRVVLPSLEIDPMRGQQVSPLQLFLYEAGEGAVVINDIDQIIAALRAFVEGPGDGPAPKGSGGKGGPGGGPPDDGSSSSGGKGGGFGGGFDGGGSAAMVN